METIDFNNVLKKYGDKPALDGFSLSIQSGEIFALVGLNGAGKTTAIKALLGISKLNAGNIAIFPNAPQPPEIGFAPEFPESFEYLSVNEFLHYSLRFFKTAASADSDYINSVVELFDLSAIREMRISELSKGNRQKVSLASAVVHRPRIVIFDEPATGLDPVARVNIKSAIKKLNEAGATILFTTHILSDVTELCHRIGIVNNGKLVFCGTPAEFCNTKPLAEIEPLFIDFLGTNEAAQSIEWIDLNQTNNPLSSSSHLNIKHAFIAATAIVTKSLRSNLVLGIILLMLPFLWGAWVFEQNNPGFQTGFIADIGTVFISLFAFILTFILSLEHIYWTKDCPTPFFYLSRISTFTLCLSRYIGILGVVSFATLLISAALILFMFVNTGSIILYPLFIAFSVIGQLILAIGLLSMFSSFLPKLVSISLLLILYITGFELESLRTFVDKLGIGFLYLLTEFILVFLPDFSMFKLDTIELPALFCILGYAIFQSLFYLLIGGKILSRRDL